MDKRCDNSHKVSSDSPFRTNLCCRIMVDSNCGGTALCLPGKLPSTQSFKTLGGKRDRQWLIAFAFEASQITEARGPVRTRRKGTNQPRQENQPQIVLGNQLDCTKHYPKMNNISSPKGQKAGDFASRLKQARHALGFTQRDMAFSLGIKQTRYAKYESGRSEAPYEVLARIAHLTNLSLDELVLGEAKKIQTSESPLELLLQDLLDVIPIPAVIYDEESRLVGHNEAFQEMFFEGHPSVIRPGTPHETVLRTFAYSRGYNESETEAFIQERLNRRKKSAVQEIQLRSQRVRFAESYYGQYCLILVMDLTETG